MQDELREQIHAKAYHLGFDLVGITPPHPIPHLEAYRAWLAQGYHGKMGYMARPDRVERRNEPAKILPGVRSIVCVGLNYYPGPPPAQLGNALSRGRISNYAWGLDYHGLMTDRLEELAAFIDAQTEKRVAHRAYVDTGPVLERAYAARAGLGFIGKNTCLIHPRLGSWLFLGELLLDLELEPSSGEIGVDCGACQRCLEACPTGALVAPRVLDARRCISYLTIELKGPIPRKLRPLMDNWIYGCDLCQAVCPWQRFARLTGERSLHAASPDRAAPLLPDLVGMSEEAFRRRFKDTPILRIGRRRLLRNVTVALGNQGDEQAAPALAAALADAEPLVRGHAAWALGRIGGREARRALSGALQRETDPYVQEEIRLAMQIGNSGPQ